MNTIRPSFEQISLPNPDEMRQLTLISPFDTILNQPAAQVPRYAITFPSMQSLADRMEAYCRGEAHKGGEQRRMVGIAAVQLGINVDAITLDATAGDPSKPSELVTIFRPHVSRCIGSTVLGRDACWSAAPFAGLTELYENIELTGFDRKGGQTLPIPTWPSSAVRTA